MTTSDRKGYLLGVLSQGAMPSREKEDYHDRGSPLSRGHPPFNHYCMYNFGGNTAYYYPGYSADYYYPVFLELRNLGLRSKIAGLNVVLISANPDALC